MPLIRGSDFFRTSDFGFRISGLLASSYRYLPDFRAALLAGTTADKLGDKGMKR